jgi:excisionase family DNA binding protein
MNPVSPDRPLERLLTAHEVADLLQVHLRTVRRLVADGGLPCVRVGTRVRFDPRDVLRWVSARKEG